MHLRFPFPYVYKITIINTPNFKNFCFVLSNELEPIANEPTATFNSILLLNTKATTALEKPHIIITVT